jgi:hypothetical protein
MAHGSPSTEKIEILCWSVGESWNASQFSRRERRKKYHDPSFFSWPLKLKAKRKEVK